MSHIMLVFTALCAGCWFARNLMESSTSLYRGERSKRDHRPIKRNESNEGDDDMTSALGLLPVQHETATDEGRRLRLSSTPSSRASCFDNSVVDVRRGPPWQAALTVGAEHSLSRALFALARAICHCVWIWEWAWQRIKVKALCAKGALVALWLCVPLAVRHNPCDTEAVVRYYLGAANNGTRYEFLMCCIKP
eukprot:3114354-Prymnesium_polylepis.1